MNVSGVSKVLAVAVACAALAGVVAAHAEDPAEEKVVARHEGFSFPDGFETTAGGKLPKGVYDLVLLRVDDRYVIQLVNKETGKGTRVAAEAVGELVGDWTGRSDETKVVLRSEEGMNALEFICEGFTASFPLKGIHK